MSTLANRSTSKAMSLSNAHKALARIEKELLVIVSNSPGRKSAPMLVRDVQNVIQQIRGHYIARVI